MDNPVLSGNRTTSAERRRHDRHRLKAFSTVVVQLGPNNGGSLLDIGGGGLSLQAVSKLHPQVELNLRFRLEGMTEAIDAVGRVTWLGPTQKVAGISFKNLPDSTEQQIVQWVATQQRARPTEHLSSSSAALPPPPISPHRIRRTQPDPVHPPLPSVPVSQYEISPQKKIVLPLNNSLESLAAHSEPILDTITLSKTAAALSPIRSISLDPSLISSVDVNSASDRLRESFASQARWRRWKFAIAVVVVVVGILALLVLTPQGAGWIDRAKTFLGMNVPAKLDPAKAGVPVWAVPRDGTYFCANDPNFQKLEPGGMTTQGEALQNKYKPKVDYCQ